MTNVQGARLVGSIDFDDAETVMRTAAEHLGDRLKRIPDGEVSERWHWIGFQPGRIAETEGIGRVGDEPYLVRGLDFRPVRIDDDVHASEGAARRIATAKRHVARDFGVATECGFGRAPQGTAVPRFEAHRAVSAAW